MEENQLNFNRPLLSVRRYSATTVSSEADDKRKTAKSQPKLPPLPAYKSELKSGPVRNPGTVPFIWEQIPGRPKDESIPKNHALEGSQVAPRLPPGRVSKVKKQGLDKGSKGTTAAQSQNGNILSSSHTISAMERKVDIKEETSKERKGERTGSENGDETYLDALSRTESAYMNCSVSGLSGLDGPDIIPCGTFSTDPQTRDFMMGRFLPAAKAMASETPHNAPRKHPVAREQPISREEPRRVKKIMTGDKQHQSNQYRPVYIQDIAQEAREDEGMRMPVQLPIYSVCRVLGNSSYAGSHTEAENKHGGTGVYRERLISRDQEAGLHEDNIDLKRESDQISNRSDGLPLDGSSVNRRLQGSGISPYRRECSQSILHDGKCFLGIPEKAKRSKETSSSDKYRKGCRFLERLSSENAEWEARIGSPVVEKTLYVDSVQTVKSSSSNSFFSDIKGEIKGLIDYKRNDLDIPERSEVEETLLADCTFQDIEHLGNVNEKAAVQSKCLDFSKSSSLSSAGKSYWDVQKITRNGRLQDQKDYNKLAISEVANKEEVNFESQLLDNSDDPENCHGLTEECIRLTSVKLADEENTDLKILERKTSDTDDISHGLVQNSITLIRSKVGKKGKIDLESQRLVTLGNQGSSEGENTRLPLGPPLPKSPSESWLKRTLPTISSRNSASQSSLGSRIYTSSPVSKISSLDPKWETIVRTSNVHHGRSRFSEELLTPIPEA
ncbi:PREDICTED: uncharacterized protein LOC101308888 [Fragaria vesca subsp. vesca]|uniref:uncharacterized protein LOC101308888 n=1 Tax=Fragaria vesca subsp. vesca TaxID=101020 RepID=UPI0002C34816|nr:PREDICTED: uncharacterized protein LOC101308888 [Fragaria vesca subsp. vesca]